jgi:hypothetical protein
MDRKEANLNLLVGEYKALGHEAAGGDVGDPDINWNKLEALLLRESAWTRRGAIELVSLVRNYGSFFLRNAAALALALGIEDGDKGL